jgi:hypothetical protein
MQGGVIEQQFGRAGMLTANCLRARAQQFRTEGATPNKRAPQASLAINLRDRLYLQFR